jgi:hypothetical protein
LYPFLIAVGIIAVGIIAVEITVVEMFAVKTTADRSNRISVQKFVPKR